MNMGMTMVPNPEMETVTKPKFKEYPIQTQKQIHKLRVYVDEEHDRYYIDYFAFEEMAVQMLVEGLPMYYLGNTCYKGDLKDQSISLGGYDGLLAISKKTLAELKREFNDEIDYVYLNRNKDLNFNYNLDSNEIGDNEKINDFSDNDKPDELKSSNYLNPTDIPTISEVNQSGFVPINNGNINAGYNGFTDDNQFKM